MDSDCDFDNKWYIDEEGEVNADYLFLQDVQGRNLGVEPPKNENGGLPWLWVGIGAVGGTAILVFFAIFLSRGGSESSNGGK